MLGLVAAPKAVFMWLFAVPTNIFASRYCSLPLEKAFLLLLILLLLSWLLVLYFLSNFLFTFFFRFRAIRGVLWAVAATVLYPNNVYPLHPISFSSHKSFLLLWVRVRTFLRLRRRLIINFNVSSPPSLLLFRLGLPFLHPGTLSPLRSRGWLRRSSRRLLHCNFLALLLLSYSIRCLSLGSRCLGFWLWICLWRILHIV